MRRTFVLGTTAALLLTAAMAGCSGSSSSTNASRTRTVAVPTMAPETFDVTLSGGLTARWRTGDDGTGMTCVVHSGQLDAGIYGGISNSTYSLAIRQGTFAPGDYDIPGNRSSDRTPQAQIVTSSNPQAAWDLGPDSRTSGTVTLDGGDGKPLLVTIDGAFADVLGGAAVDVSATFNCTLQTG